MCPAVPTLKESPEFQRVSRDGKKFHAGAFVMLVLKTNEDMPFRVGFTVSKKVGNAVIRNRARRRLREMIRLQLKENPMQGIEVVLIARTAAATCEFEVLGRDFKKGLEHARVKI